MDFCIVLLFFISMSHSIYMQFNHSSGSLLFKRSDTGTLTLREGGLKASDTDPNLKSNSQYK